MGIFTLLPLILGSIIAYLLIKKMRTAKPQMGKFSIQLNKSTQFKMLVTFMALLVLLTIASEVVTSGKPPAELPPKADDKFEQEMWMLEERIMNHEKIDDAFLLEKRVHPAGNALVIQQSEDPFDDPTIFIERKSNEDQTIEERLYKQVILINGYDYSGTVEFATPIWANNTVSLPEANVTARFATFGDANMLNQLTKSGSYDMTSNGFSSSRPFLIHLIVPEDLEIIANDEDYFIFLDE